MVSAVCNINDDILTIDECCTHYTQCCTDANEVLAVEMTMNTYQIMQCDDNKEKKSLCLLIIQTQN